MNLSLTDMGGSFTFTDTERKLGTMPRMRFVCLPSRLSFCGDAAGLFALPLCCWMADASGASGMLLAVKTGASCAWTTTRLPKIKRQAARTTPCLKHEEKDKSIGVMILPFVLGVQGNLEAYKESYIGRRNAWFRCVILHLLRLFAKEKYFNYRRKPEEVGKYFLKIEDCPPFSGRIFVVYRALIGFSVASKNSSMPSIRRRSLPEALHIRSGQIPRPAPRRQRREWSPHVPSQAAAPRLCGCPC
jgi:hypothetical protein